MRWTSLGQFIQFLKEKNEIVFIREEVDPVLEIAEIADRLMKAEGPALYLEKVRGSRFPVVINLYGSRQRMSWALGVEDLEATAHRLKALLTTQAPEGFWEKLKMVPKLAEIARSTPKTVS